MTTKPIPVFSVSYSGNPTESTPLEATARIKGGRMLPILLIARMASCLLDMENGDLLSDPEVGKEAAEVVALAHDFLGISAAPDVALPLGHLVTVLEHICSTFCAGPFEPGESLRVGKPATGIRSSKSGTA